VNYSFSGRAGRILGVLRAVWTYGFGFHESFCSDYFNGGKMGYDSL
jgi:hypothetical protein